MELLGSSQNLRCLSSRFCTRLPTSWVGCGAVLMLLFLLVSVLGRWWKSSTQPSPDPLQPCLGPRWSAGVTFYGTTAHSSAEQN